MIAALTHLLSHVSALRSMMKGLPFWEGHKQSVSHVFSVGAVQICGQSMTEIAKSSHFSKSERAADA